MPLAFDPGYIKAIEPLLPLLASFPKPQIHDIQTRRDNLAALFTHTSSLLTFPPTITQSTITIPAHDSHPITLLYTRPAPSPTATNPPPNPTPAILHIHPGGIIAGSPALLATPLARATAAHTHPTFSVAYRKPPEHPFPTALLDAYAALEHLHAHAKDYNIDLARIAITGESAGGGIALAVALMARDRGLEPPVRKLVLGCPMLDARTGKEAEEGLVGVEGLLSWGWESNVTAWTAYLGPELERGEVSAYAAPARAESFAGLPDVFVDVPELDIFRGEVVGLVGRLLRENLGRGVEFHLWKGVPHAFELLAPEFETSRLAREVRGRALREL